MKFTIHPEEQKDLLSITIEGEFDFNKVLNRAEELINAGYQSGKKMILVDAINVKGNIATGQRYDLAEGLSKPYHSGMARNKFGLKIAVFTNESILSADRIEQTFIDNRSILLKFFTSKKEAVKWLENGSNHL